MCFDEVEYIIEFFMFMSDILFTHSIDYSWFGSWMETFKDYVLLLTELWELTGHLEDL